MSIRRLAAIMFTDIAGYTAMMQEDELRARQCRDRHRSVLEALHQQYGGEVVQYYGDGSLSIFTSGLQAVRCAREMQLAFRMAPEVPVRIGLHTGEVVREETGIYGDSVNIAARIESLSVPGAVMISDKLVDEIKNHTDIVCHSMGIFSLKNVARKTEVFALSDEGLHVPAPGELKGKLSINKKSIAVLPFVNMSADPDNEYFSEGISEEILNVLARLENFQVTARTSSFAFKGKNLDVREIGRMLNVQTILEGSVRKAGNRVRITAQLINTADGYHFWSETYDRDLEDIFAIQDEVTHKIVEKLKANFSEEARKSKLIKPPTENLTAYELYLKGMYYLYKLTPEDLFKSIEYAEAAIQEDPEYIQAYILSGYSHFFLGEADLISAEESMQKTRLAFDKIIASGGNPSMIHTITAMEWLLFKNKIEPTGTLLQKALTHNSNDILTNVLGGFYWMVLQDFDKMQAYFLKAGELDPVNPLSTELASWGNFHRGEYAETRKRCHRILKNFPGHRPCLETLGWICDLEGDFEGALAWKEQIVVEFGLRVMKSASLGYTYGRMGRHDKAKECIDTILRLKKEMGGNRFELNLCLVYLGMGDLDEFFNLWGKALENSAPSAILFFPFPFILEHKDDPRYIALRKKYMPEAMGS